MWVKMYVQDHKEIRVRSYYPNNLIPETSKIYN